MASTVVRQTEAFKTAFFSETPDWSMLSESFSHEEPGGQVDKATLVAAMAKAREMLAGSTAHNDVELVVGDTVLFTVVRRLIAGKTRVMFVVARTDDTGRISRFFELAKMLPDQADQGGAMAICRPLFDAILDPASAPPFTKVADDCALAAHSVLTCQAASRSTQRSTTRRASRPR